MKDMDLKNVADYKDNVKSLKEKSQLACKKISGSDCDNAVTKADNIVKKILGK